MTRQLHKAVGAYLASPSIAPMLPPPVGIPRRYRERLHIDNAIAGHHPLAHLMRLRDQAAAEVERLLTFLDLTDGDLDLTEADAAEPSDAELREFGLHNEDDEPSLCGMTAEKLDEPISRLLVDLEQEEGNDEDCGNDEPSLGSLSARSVQVCWAGGSSDDCEGDAAGEDDEPSLGAHSTDERSQEHWAQGDRNDAEGHDCDMEPSLCGIGDHEFQPQPVAGSRDLDLEANEVMACAL